MARATSTDGDEVQRGTWGQPLRENNHEAGKTATGVRFSSGEHMTVLEPARADLVAAWVAAAYDTGPLTLDVTALHTSREGWPSYRATVMLPAIEVVYGEPA